MNFELIVFCSLICYFIPSKVSAGSTIENIHSDTHNCYNCILPKLFFNNFAMKNVTFRLHGLINLYLLSHYHIGSSYMTN